MKLKNIASNVTEIIADNGSKIMFSYETPVSGYINNYGFFKTTTKHSVTTTKHINRYLREALKDNANFEHETINEVPQELINSWVNVYFLSLTTN
jgi:hypothetical protein